MKLLFGLPFTALAAVPALADDGGVFALWGEDSGALPPQYARAYSVTFTADRRGAVRCCKGYADAPPGCATATFRLSERRFADLQDALAPLASDLAARPAVQDPNPPVDGGSVGGRVTQNGAELPLWSHPLPDDAARVGAVIALVQEYSSGDALFNARSHAVQP